MSGGDRKVREVDTLQAKKNELKRTDSNPVYMDFTGFLRSGGTKIVSFSAVLGPTTHQNDPKRGPGGAPGGPGGGPGGPAGAPGAPVLVSLGFPCIFRGLASYYIDSRRYNSGNNIGPPGEL